MNKSSNRSARALKKAGPCTVREYFGGEVVAERVVHFVQPAQGKALKVSFTATAGARPAKFTQNGVSVNGVEYGSLRKAFAALGLPDNKHVKFRAELKRAGALAFEHGGKTYPFIVIA